VSSYLVAGGWLPVGAAVGFGVRRLSVWLARREELEPGFQPWQVWGPVAMTAVLFAVFGWRFGATPLLLITSLWVALLVQVIFFDLEHRLILDRLMFPAYVVALVLSIFTPHLGWKQAAIAGVAVEALGFAAEDAKALGIGYCPKGIMRGTLAVPVRLEDGTLAGYLGITDAKLPPRWHGIPSTVVPFAKKTA